MNELVSGCSSTSTEASPHSETYKANFVVWWFWTDPFSGNTQRQYRDFQTIRGARVFARTKDGAEYDTISSQPWHHSHARSPSDSRFVCGAKPQKGLQAQ